MKKILINKERLSYYKNNWKLGIHLILRTKRFGVNNKWWESFDSLFGYSFLEKLKLLRPKNFKSNLLMIHFRAIVCFFLTDKEIHLVYNKSREEVHKKYFKILYYSK